MENEIPNIFKKQGYTSSKRTTIILTKFSNNIINQHSILSNSIHKLTSNDSPKWSTNGKIIISITFEIV